VLYKVTRVAMQRIVSKLLRRSHLLRTTVSPLLSPHWKPPMQKEGSATDPSPMVGRRERIHPR
jgi:hypothetical protein